MEESSTSIKTIIINFGIILGLTSVVFQLMLYFFYMHYKNDTTAGIISLIIMIGILILVLSQPYLTNSATVNTLDSQLTLIIAMALYDTLKWLTLREVYHFD